jgi:hypothetical protein
VQAALSAFVAPIHAAACGPASWPNISNARLTPLGIAGIVDRPPLFLGCRKRVLHTGCDGQGLLSRPP